MKSSKQTTQNSLKDLGFPFIDTNCFFFFSKTLRGHHATLLCQQNNKIEFFFYSNSIGFILFLMCINSNNTYYWKHLFVGFIIHYNSVWVFCLFCNINWNRFNFIRKSKKKLKLYLFCMIVVNSFVVWDIFICDHFIL